MTILKFGYIKLHKKVFLGFLSLLALVITFVLYLNCKTIKIDIISFNDFHGAIESKNEVGASKFVYAIKQWTNSNAIIVSGGDNYNGEVLSNLLYGKPVNDIFREIGVFTSAIGNHEFDWGLDKFKNWEKDMGANFISANVFLKNGKMLFKPYIIKEINGVKVGFIGLTTQETKFKGNQNIVKNLIFKDPVIIAEKYVKKLKNQGVDIIILLTHIGTYTDKNDGKIYFKNKNLEKLTEIDGVNAIITAHYHDFVSGKINEIPITQSLSKGKAISKMEFILRKKDKKLKDIKLSSRLLFKEKELLKDDNNILNIIKKYRKSAISILEKKLGVLEKDSEYERYKKSPLGSVYCEILRKKTNSQIAVINGGAIRNGLKAGSISYKQIYETLPFDSIAIKLEMSGKDIKKLFSYGTRGVEIGYMQYSGLNIDGDNLILDDGEIVEDSKLYTITANDFMVSGGDKYDFSKAKKTGEFGIIREIIIDESKEFLK